MNSNISTGTSVIDSSAAPAIEKVFVKASGLNIRPSCASSVNTGRKETVIISRLKNSAGPTSLHAAMMPSSREAPGDSRSRCLCAFSIITIAASTMAPMAIAIPPRLMMFELSPMNPMMMNAISTPTGSMTTATRALRAWNRNSMQTSATIRLSSTSVRLRFLIARLIRSDRS